MSLLEHIPPALLVIFRIGGLMIYAPALGSNVVPVRVKVLLAFVLGAAVYPLLAASGRTALGLELDLWMLAPLIALELLIGLVIGYLASLPLTSLQIGGVIASQQMGLGFAQLYNPAIDDESDVIGQIMFFLALATFLLVGGLDAMMLALLNTFEHVPAGGVALDQSFVMGLAGLFVASLEVALRVAAPLLCIIFLENVALGFLSKTVPQLNILSLGFPMRILVGLAVLSLGLAVLSDVILEDIESAFGAIGAWIEGQGQ